MANQGPWERQLRWGILGIFSLIGLNVLLFVPSMFTGPIGWGIGQMVWRQGLPPLKLASADVMALHTGLLAALFSAVVQGPDGFSIYPAPVVVPVLVVVFLVAAMVWLFLSQSRLLAAGLALFDSITAGFAVWQISSAAPWSIAWRSLSIYVLLCGIGVYLVLRFAWKTRAPREDVAAVFD